MTRLRKLREGVAHSDAVKPERSLFHQLSIAEGTSFLLLMLVAVPLKRITGEPLWVSVVGSLHGSLFILYIIAVLFVAPVFRWRPLTTLLALAAAVFPFGPFLFEAYLRRIEKAQPEGSMTAGTSL
ncbi:MAG: DUF3817 domain-containing protein [Fibrella sp.]|nr:DUF3817 domain-containing protein [Armatimonadota bacterium]